jgi:aminobenzoyl-glutamate utilization protein B
MTYARWVRLLTVPCSLALAASLVARPSAGPRVRTLQEGQPRGGSGLPTAYTRLDGLKANVVGDIESMRQTTQQMVDQIFSYAELGYQEFETSKYLVGILERNGFRIEPNVAGMPTGWVATWGTGKPVIALGSDIDDIPQASQKPGVAYHDPIVAGAPGHGEGHNSGMPLQVTAALAVKEIMEREQLTGTLKVWPGVAEELGGGKAYFVRAGAFSDVDICLFAHVGNNFNVSWGDRAATGVVSVEYTFKGESAHAAANPWRGRSALDAVELMDIGWNFRREHLRLSQRSHYVITNGGDQPNVVPSNASVWYYFREIDYPHIKEIREIGDTMARAAAMMTNTEVSWRVTGVAWPQHFNKIIAENMYENVKTVGLPKWDDNDITLAKAIQKELSQPQRGLASEISLLQAPVRLEDNYGGGSDDIGDVSWNVPTVTLNYPSNIPGMPGHNWANAVAMATPIAHKGATAGAKVIAMTALDFLLRPELVQQAWDYFRNTQTKDQKYESLLGPADQPIISFNAKTMEQYRPELRKYYFDPTKYRTYLEQLGIKYPTVK